MRRNTLVAAFVTLASTSSLPGCVSYYTDSPVFQEVKAPAELGVIYVMRPPSQFGMIQDIRARLDDERWFDLFPGSYGAFLVKPGKTKVRVGIDVWATVGIFGMGAVSVAGAEVDAKATTLEVDVPPGGAVYIETSVAGWKEPPDANVVPVYEGRSDIEDLHLTAGGRPHALKNAATAVGVGTKPTALPPVVPSAPDAIAELARAVDRVARACTPNPALEGTCEVKTEEAKLAIADARAATDRVRAAELPLDAARAFLTFSSMLEAVSADRVAGHPVTLSKIGALTKAMKDVQSVATKAEP